MSDVPNPWAADNWNLTEQGRYVEKYGVEVAKRKARQAGSSLGGLRPKNAPGFEVRNFILIKKMGETGGAQGTSSDGPPGS